VETRSMNARNCARANQPCCRRNERGSDPKRSTPAGHLPSLCPSETRNGWLLAVIRGLRIRSFLSTTFSSRLIQPPESGRGVLYGALFSGEGGDRLGDHGQTVSELQIGWLSGHPVQSRRRTSRKTVEVGPPGAASDAPVGSPARVRVLPTRLNAFGRLVAERRVMPRPRHTRRWTDEHGELH
jgi:hypothetical protein